MVYLPYDFYSKVSKNIWQPIERDFEEDGNTYTSGDTQDYVDDRAAVWESVEVEDLKRAIAWLRKKKVKNPIKFRVIDENGHDVTDQF